MINAGNRTMRASWSFYCHACRCTSGSLDRLQSIGSTVWRLTIELDRRSADGLMSIRWKDRKFRISDCIDSHLARQCACKSFAFNSIIRKVTNLGRSGLKWAFTKCHFLVCWLELTWNRSYWLEFAKSILNTLARPLRTTRHSIWILFQSSRTVLSI